MFHIHKLQEPMLFPFPIFSAPTAQGSAPLLTHRPTLWVLDYITLSLSHLTQSPSFYPGEVAQQPELSLGSRSRSFLTAPQSPQGFFLTLPGKLLPQSEEPHNLPSVACGSGSVASRGFLWSSFLALIISPPLLGCLLPLLQGLP